MAKRRNLGHISTHHAMKSAVVKFIDENDICRAPAGALQISQWVI